VELEYAEQKVEFVNLRIENHITKFDRVNLISRESMYVEEQKSRRCRVAFESLRDYFRKATRNTYIVNNPEIESSIINTLDFLKTSSSQVKKLDKQIENLLSSTSEVPIDEGFRSIVGYIPSNNSENFIQAKNELNTVMYLVAVELNSQWNSDRYVRGEFNLDS